jgi:hypothetical protein
MNKKLLICGAIATTLFLTACVKKEEPQTEQPEVAETPAVEQIETPAEFEALDAVDSSQPVATIVETQVAEVVTTAPAAPRETRPVAEEAQTAPAAKPQAAPAQDTETQYTPKNTGSSQSQDDAVNDAIAAALPALEN